MVAHPSDDPEAQAIAAFTREVPEIAAGAVVIRAVARTPGARTKVAVDSDDPNVDFMRLCFGWRGTRIRNVAAALGGEAIHVVTWSSYPDVMVRHALAPLRVARVELDETSRRARVTIPRNQRPKVLATLEEQRGLASRLAGWEIELFIDPNLA